MANVVLNLLAVKQLKMKLKWADVSLMNIVEYIIIKVTEPLIVIKILSRSKVSFSEHLLQQETQSMLRTSLSFFLGSPALCARYLITVAYSMVFHTQFN